MVKKIKSKFKYIILIILIIFFIIYITFKNCKTRKKCKNKDDNGIIIKQINLNYEFMDSFIKNELNIIKNNNIVTKFIDNEDITNFLKNEITKTLGPDFFIADRGLWLRYYNSDKYINPFENWHYDRKRYSYNTKQYRIVINLFDNSKSNFCYTLKCLNNKEECIITKKNTLVLIEANETYHQLKLENGERLVLMVDVVNNSKKGICGTFFSIWDYIWLNIIVNNSIGNVK